MTEHQIRKGSLKVPIKYLLLAIALLALACIGIAVMLKELHEAQVRLHEVGISEFPDTAYDMVIEFFKTVFIGACLAFAIDAYLKYLEIVQSQKETLSKSGIKALYSSRSEAAEEFTRLVTNEQVKTIAICGISLRDFLTVHSGEMHSVWTAIKRRLANEERDNLAPEQRLHVRLLRLDPRSAEGHFRYGVEDPIAVKTPVDINKGFVELQRTWTTIYQKRPQEYLQSRMYEHCPFSFLFLTETTAFVEQYFYKIGDLEASLPLIEYARDNAQHTILKQSLETIWANADCEGIQIGTAIPIEEARIRNIYLANQRPEQGKHQVERIKNHTGKTIDILNITGGFYVTDYDASTALRSFAAKAKADGGTIRFALLNPVSQPAILRAVADECRTEEIGEALKTHDWRRHQHSKLYTRIRETIEVINKWAKEHSVELRLYSCSTTCALLLTSESAFVGHYLYGRSRRLQVENRLQSEYPMLEYGRPAGESVNDSQLEILHSTFDIVWSHYSISYEDYKLDNREETFNKNLKRLREELCLPTS
jgi:hypothetical protein